MSPSCYGHNYIWLSLGRALCAAPSLWWWQWLWQWQWECSPDVANPGGHRPRVLFNFYFVSGSLAICNLQGRRGSRAEPSCPWIAFWPKLLCILHSTRAPSTPLAPLATRASFALLKCQIIAWLLYPLLGIERVSWFRGIGLIKTILLWWFLTMPRETLFTRLLEVSKEKLILIYFYLSPLIIRIGFRY